MLRPRLQDDEAALPHSGERVCTDGTRRTEWLACTQAPGKYQYRTAMMA